MTRKSILGNCRLCGRFAKLSFEHVPPRSAFNDRPIVNANIRKLIGSAKLDDLDQPSGTQQQRGAGGYTLCESCNNKTGHWYGGAYVDWVYQAASLLHRAGPAPSLYYLFHIFPLRIIKQIVCMFFSANGPGFQQTHPDLVRFVLNRDLKYLDSRIKIHAFYTFGDKSRQAGITGMMELSDHGLGVKRSHVFSEIAFPPFGYVLSEDSPPVDRRLVDISFFATSSYYDWKDVALKLPLLSIYTLFPGDYRSRDEVAAGVPAKQVT